jgi:hypothetical protein
VPRCKKLCKGLIGLKNAHETDFYDMAVRGKENFNAVKSDISCIKIFQNDELLIKVSWRFIGWQLLCNNLQSKVHP